MSQSTATRARTRRTLGSAAFCLLVAAAIIGTLGYQSASSSAPSFSDPPRFDHGGTRVEAGGAVGDGVTVLDEAPSLDGPPPGDLPHLDHGGETVEAGDTITEADGALPDGVTVSDDRYPGIANLDLDLLRALGVAATDGADDGITFYVNSGWRSTAYQDRLLRQAITQYGSEEEAARWVATADTSAHVSGDAVDIGPSDAQAWLSEHGAGYGLCQIYVNEPWHFELLPAAIDGGCPAMYADPTHDPRMQ